MTVIKGEGESVESELTLQEEFDSYIKELQVERTRVAQEDKAYLEVNPPRGIGPHGSTEIYRLSNQILAAVEVGKKLGLVAKEKDPYDYL